MAFLGRLALLFVLVPVLELLLLVRMGEWVGLWPTLALVVSTGAAGAALARAEGLRVLFRFQQELASGRLPGQALLDGISVLVGGAFLLTPGIVTDLAGFALLLPASRRRIQRVVMARLERRMREGTIRVVAMGPAGFGGAWGGPTGGTRGGLDPRHEIRVDPDGDL